ncbi:Pentatricopeptide repeat-containing protein [Glycine soja]
MENPCEISLWNGLMAGYTKNYMYVEALELFEKLLHYPYLKPDSYTYPSVFKACGGLHRYVLGKMIHTCLIKTGLMMDIVVGSSLVGMYGKCNAFEKAIWLFNEMPEKDVACWNTVISCYYQSGNFKDALEYFGLMRRFGFEPNSVTITTAISSCARLLDLNRGMEIHEELINSGFLLDSFISSALVDMYGKCGHLEMAIEIFEQMPKKTVVAWNSMISGYGLKGDIISCIQLFKRMYNEGVKPTLTTLSSLIMVCSRSARLLEGKFVHGYTIRNRIQPDVFVNSSLMDLYFKCGKVELAEKIFKLIPKSKVVSWNVMISGYVAEGKLFEALGLFSEMRKSYVESDAITFTSVLTACSQLAALEKGKEIHNLIIEKKLDNNEVVMGALLDMYAKCGAVDEAFSVFKCLPKRDLVSWTSMITAYGSHGHAYGALELFAEMLQSNVKPDRVAFLAILSACGHAGLVDEGCYYFNQMINVYGIIPRVEHYSCLIDLLGRAGRLHEAYEILQQNPEIRDDVELLSTLFSACRLHRNIDLGAEIARTLIDKDPDDSSTYILLSNMYASAHKWDEVRVVRSKMKELGLKKNPGCMYNFDELSTRDRALVEKLSQKMGLSCTFSGRGIRKKSFVHKTKKEVDTTRMLGSLPHVTFPEESNQLTEECVAVHQLSQKMGFRIENSGSGIKQKVSVHKIEKKIHTTTKLENLPCFTFSKESNQVLGGLLMRYLSGDEVLWGEMIGAYSDPTNRTKQKACLNSHSVNSKLSPQKTFDCSLVVYDENEITINDCSMWIRNCTVVGLLPLFLLSKEIAVALAKDCTEGHKTMSSDNVTHSTDVLPHILLLHSVPSWLSGIPQTSDCANTLTTINATNPKEFQTQLINQDAHQINPSEVKASEPEAIENPSN